jgi:hypothetical protein
MEDRIEEKKAPQRGRSPFVVARVEEDLDDKVTSWHQPKLKREASRSRKNRRAKEGHDVKGRTEQGGPGYEESRKGKEDQGPSGYLKRNGDARAWWAKMLLLCLP